MTRARISSWAPIRCFKTKLAFSWRSISTRKAGETTRRPDIGLSSFDRFFPNQDTLPKGGFGSPSRCQCESGRGNLVTAHSSMLQDRFDPRKRPSPDHVVMSQRGGSGSRCHGADHDCQRMLTADASLSAARCSLAVSRCGVAAAYRSLAVSCWVSAARRSLALSRSSGAI
jgi:TOTE conflict system, Archaeo-Eukaryotic Primase domain